MQENTLPLDNPGEQQCERPFHLKGRRNLDLGTVWETQASNLATQHILRHCQLQLLRHAREGASPVLTPSTESGPLKPSCLETSCSRWTGERSPPQGTPRGKAGLCRQGGRAQVQSPLTHQHFASSGTESAVSTPGQA